MWICEYVFVRMCNKLSGNKSHMQCIQFDSNCVEWGCKAISNDDRSRNRIEVPVSFYHLLEQSKAMVPTNISHIIIIIVIVVVLVFFLLLEKKTIYLKQYMVNFDGIDVIIVCRATCWTSIVCTNIKSERMRIQPWRIFGICVSNLKLKPVAQF